jgi:cellulose synthase operon protein YhjQ
MGSRGTEMDDQPTADSTPEDVAVLYSWANLQGAKYRDYSASRREYRAQVRYRAAKALLERELEAQGRAGSSGERLEAARRAEAAARVTVLALREEREIAEAHESARQQAQVYEESERLRRLLAGPQPQPRVASSSAGSATAEWNEIRSIDTARGADDVHNFDPARSFDTAGGEVDPIRPAWLYSGQEQRPQAESQASVQPERPDALVSGLTGRGRETSSGGNETLLDSQERVAASRWIALQGLFEPMGAMPTMQPVRPGQARMPLLAVYSLAGGVGKTSLVATLGRALSSLGEKVLLTDTTPHGLLPFYFGLRELAAGAAREVALRKQGEAVSLVFCDTAGRGEDERLQEKLLEEILRGGEGRQRVLLDLSAGSDWLLRRMADLHPTVLVPIAPDMNSVVSLQAMERMFRGITDSEGRPLLPYYVLNQFDASLPLHLDIRELFRRQLGERLLRIAVRRSQSVCDALAEGMTVVDYAPEAPVARDYHDVANWLRSASPSTAEGIRSVRRGER